MTIYIPAELALVCLGWILGLLTVGLVALMSYIAKDAGKYRPPATWRNPNSGYNPAPAEPRADPPIPPRSG